MKKNITATVLAITLSCSAQLTFANSGKQQHDKHCTQCHDSKVYTRDNRKVTDIEKLKNQVTTCTTMLNLHMFPAQEKPIVNYLNNSYYHF
jgi:hypothetical protein